MLYTKDNVDLKHPRKEGQKVTTRKRTDLEFHLSHPIGSQTVYLMTVSDGMHFIFSRISLEPWCLDFLLKLHHISFLDGTLDLSKFPEKEADAVWPQTTFQILLFLWCAQGQIHRQIDTLSSLDEGLQIRQKSRVRDRSLSID